MKKSLLFLVFLLIPMMSSAKEYLNVDGSKVSITRPSGLDAHVDSLLDAKIAWYLPEKIEPVTLSGDLSGTSQDPRNWEYDIDIKKVYEDDTIISLLMTTYEYTGGAHGSTARFGIVVDKKTWKQLDIGEVFQSHPLLYRLGATWRYQILRKLALSLGKLDPATREWVREGTIDIQNYQSFTLTNLYLTIYGQDYQHNAHAYGVQTLHYPLIRLRDIMQK